MPGAAQGAAPASADAVPVPVILDRVRGELEELHGLGLALEDRLGAALPLQARREGELREALQWLDRLNQSTAALSAFLARLAEAAARSEAVDPRPLAASVTLRDMAERLGEGACLPPTHAAGDVEFF